MNVSRLNDIAAERRLWRRVVIGAFERSMKSKRAVAKHKS